MKHITIEQMHEIAVAWSNRKFADGAARFIEDFGREVIAAHDALTKAAVITKIAPNGWKLVPILPTAEMITAGQQHTERDDDDGESERQNYRARGEAMAVYMDMVNAAPPMPDNANV